MEASRGFAEGLGSLGAFATLISKEIGKGSLIIVRPYCAEDITTIMHL